MLGSQPHQSLGGVFSSAPHSAGWGHPWAAGAGAWPEGTRHLGEQSDFRLLLHTEGGTLLASLSSILPSGVLEGSEKAVQTLLFFLPHLEGPGSRRGSQTLASRSGCTAWGLQA